jgi:hypothetical protein
VKIAILVEGATEVAFKEKLCKFLRGRLSNQMPRLDFIPQDGRIPKETRLKRLVENLLNCSGYDAVIALTDVYTGTDDFQDAADAKTKMRQWAGSNPNFYPHTALHDFEAWLLPYWTTIQKIANHNRTAPKGAPEMINHQSPPAYRIKEIFSSGRRQDYNKPIHGKRILKDNDLMIAIQACPELKKFVNQILALCGGQEIV